MIIKIKLKKGGRSLAVAKESDITNSSLQPAESLDQIIPASS